MDIIAKALQRAKAKPHFSIADNTRPTPVAGEALVERERSINKAGAFTLSSSALISNRIFAQDGAHRMTRSYDVLRGQLATLNEGYTPGLLAVTAPNAGCGATTAAINLAFSFARMRDANVLLVDANLRSPSVKRLFGRSATPHAEETRWPDLSQVEVDGLHLHVFAPGQDVNGTAGRPGAAQLSRQIDSVRRSLNPSITIVDLPPLLAADETASLMSSADTVVLVLAVGQSKVAELEMCKTYLDPRAKVQVVLNKCRRHGL
ncbi:hypothetical protein QTL95_03105 [Rhizobium sp. S152]|uniref:hypothetical protein n=1 Tax=Rhizobium sp. S152 TaxID=3055038 RepID=UPI0025A9F72F|nr:hypothetical protein [Rhizobium sp. S152]MDM9624870.1 hypothetical protein [Rhizobium sp. S152]